MKTLKKNKNVANVYYPNHNLREINIRTTRNIYIYKRERERERERENYTECCVIWLGIFTSPFYFFKALWGEKLTLTSKNKAALHYFPCNICFIIRLALSSANPFSVHTSIDLVFIELPSCKPGPVCCCCCYCCCCFFFA